MKNYFLFLIAMLLLAAMGCDNMDPIKSVGDSQHALKKATDVADKKCDDGNACTTDSVDPQSKLCVYTNNTVACDDGNACTTEDKCDAGKCVGGPATDCDDKNVCTNDSCDQAKGCLHTDNTNPCDDGNACTTTDKCDAGKCEGGTSPECDDQNLCTTDSCDPAKGCVFTPNTNLCDDGNACTTEDKCDAGKCVGGPATDCDDKNVCTNDSCDQAKGCLHTDNTNPCDDGNACSSTDVCKDGKCESGTSPECDDQNPCTTDSCDPAKGCVNTLIDGCCNRNAQCFTFGETSWGYSDPCTSDEDCEMWESCVGGAMCLPLAYDFGCTVDPVDNPVDFEDGKTGTCEMCADTNQDGECSAVETFCEGGLDEDGDALVDCEDSDCDSEECGEGKVCSDGECVLSVPVPECTKDADCDDKNLCTNDSCDQAKGCLHTDNTNPCDDGNACTTTDKCDAGKCVGGPALDCDDDDPDTTDSCSPATGCINTPIVETCTHSSDCPDGYCLYGKCYYWPGPGKCATFAVKVKGDPLADIIWYGPVPGAPSTHTDQQKASGTFISKAGDCSAIVYNFAECECLLWYGVVPCQYLPGSPTEMGCWHNMGMPGDPNPV